MASARKREVSPQGMLQALGTQVLHIRALHVSCAAVLLMTMLVAGAAPSPSLAATETPLSCPFIVFVPGFRIPGPRFDLCAAWQGGNRPPIYQVLRPPKARAKKYPSCEAYLSDKAGAYGETLPRTEDLRSHISPSISLYVPAFGSRFRVRYSFDPPSGARIKIYEPTWQDITESQKRLIKAFYDRILDHEFGHKNILAALSRRFAYDGKHPFNLGPAASYGRKLEVAWSTAKRLADDAELQLVEIDKRIEVGKGGYNDLTADAKRQSFLGGTDPPSLDHLCLPVTSTFDTGNNGWKVDGDAASTVPDHRPTGGNPGGFVEVADHPAYKVWYWVAPEPYLGNKSAAYGTLLAFDLKQYALDRPFDDVDVKLSGGGVTLIKRFGSPPELDWTSYFVPLDTTGGWVDDVTKAPATKEQIQSVLGSLSLLHIRGEYQVGPDLGGLDSVVFGLPKS